MVFESLKKFYQQPDESGEIRKILNPEYFPFLRMKTKELFERIQRDKPEVIFFLDKSARPLYWMLVAYMQSIDFSEEKFGFKFPEVRFINPSTYGSRLLSLSPDDAAKAKQLQRLCAFKKVLMVDTVTTSNSTAKKAAGMLLQRIGVSGKNLLKFTFIKNDPSAPGLNYKEVFPWYKMRDFGDSKPVLAIEDDPDSLLFSRAIHDEDISALNKKLREEIQQIFVDVIDK